MFVLVAAVSLIIGGAITGFYMSSGGNKKTEIKWTILGQELTLNMEEDLANHEKMLDKLFSEEFAMNGTKAWLKKYQNLYDPRDPELAARIAKMDYDEMISEQLRDISQKRKGPWAYQYDTIQIGVPAEADQPKEGYANVCENGDYYNQRLRVLTMDQSKDILVTATGKYACPDGFKFPNIQLNAKDAERLLGTTNFSKYEQGIILILRE